jgi:hypothetical protein
MIRFGISFVAWMVFGNWVYDEVKVSFPSAVPTIDSAMEAIAIPTHDQWDKKKLVSAVNEVGSALNKIGVATFPELADIEFGLSAPGISEKVKQARATQADRQGFERF